MVLPFAVVHEQRELIQEIWHRGFVLHCAFKEKDSQNTFQDVD